MTGELVISVAERAIMIILLTSGPLLLVALITGLAVSIFQATTSIQEQTLAFVPKIVAVLVAIVFLAHGCYLKLLAMRETFLRI